MSNSATPRTVPCQAPLSMGFSREEYWSGVPFPSPEDLPDPRVKPGLPALQADSLPTHAQLGTGIALFWGAPKSVQMVTAAMKLKDDCSWGEKL